MLGLKSFLDFFIIYSFCVICLNHKIEGADSSIVGKVEELHEIRMEHSKIGRNYTDSSAKEIHNLLGKISNIWTVVNNVADVMNWWTTDVDRRHELALSKLAKVLTSSNENEAFQKLKEQFKEGLDFADQVWKNEMDKKMNKIRQNPEVYKSQSDQPSYVAEHPPPNLSPEDQKIFEKQIFNLTDVAAYVKAVIRGYYNLIESELPSKDNNTYITHKVKNEMILSKISTNKTSQVDSARKFATNRITDAWNVEGKHGPTSEEYDKEYSDLVRFGTNLVKDLDKSFKLEYEAFSN